MAHGLRAPRGKQATAWLVDVARPKLVSVARRSRSALLLSTALQASTLLLLAVPARAQPAANARPSGGIVTAGSASIGTSASTTTITQSSQRTAINWQSFNVGSQQTVDFIQPSSSSVALNRVISSNPSQIAGRIDANGQIILINQSGVIFDQGSQVNTAGLIVSAAGMNNVNFMAGKLVFDQAARPNAAVVNQGSLTVRQAGLAALVAPQVANSGMITAKLGHVVLAGAKTATLDLYGDGLVSLDVNNQVTQIPTAANGTPATALVTNTGVIQADGGTVQLTAREADGLVQNLVQAGGKISADSVGSKTGTIVLGGLGGSIALSGVVTADGSAPGSTGGQVQVDANHTVTVAAGSRVSASGPAGGGTVAIGTTLARAKGGPGTASALTAQTLEVDPGATIAANATSKGDGGHVTVLSNLSTSMAGNIYALGGPNGGNGGFIETSGHTLSIADVAVVSAAAPKGLPGTWLLDPTDVVISTDNTKAVSSNTSGGTDTFSTTDITATINNQQLDGILGAGTNVTINTTPFNAQQAGNITVNAPVTWNTATTLTLNAQGGIILNLGLTGTNAGSVLVLNAFGGTVTQASTGLITVGTLRGQSVGGATLDQGNTVNTLGPWNDTGAGSAGLTFTNTQALQTSGLVTSTGPVTLTTTAGGVTVNGTVSSDNSVTINAAGALAIPGTVNSPVLALTGDSINITGLVTDGGTGLTILAATGGGITETGGTLISGTLEGSSAGSVSLGTSSTNTIAHLDGFDVSSSTGTFVLTDIIGLSIFGPVVGPAGVYLESAGATGIQISNAKARVTAGPGANVSFQADAFSIIGGAQIEGSSSLFELAPNTPNLGVTLGASGTGLSLTSLTGINPTSLRIGAVTLPNATTPTTFAGSITIGGNFGNGSNTLDLEAHGQVTENASGMLSVGELTGTAASFTLTNPGNALSVINNLVATGGDIAVVNGQGLALMGTQSGNNLFYEVAETGSNLALGTFEASEAFPAILTAAPGGRISLVQDTLSQVIGSTVTATNGSVELAPFSPINTSLAGFTGLAIDSSILSIISTGVNGTLVVGGYTHVPANATTPTASAASVTIDGAVDLTGVAATLLLQSLGPITENAGPLTVGTLAATGTVITLNTPNNAINALGDVNSTSFTLNDILGLTLTGDVLATVSASITDTVSLTQTGDLTSPSITLSAGNGGIALDAPSVLGQAGATVSLTSSGGVNQAAGATLIAGTLQTLTAGITGGAATFAGTNNAIATLGSFNVTGNPLSLSDTGTLNISGPVIASSVTIGGTAGSTPTGITLTGDLTAPTITLSAAGGGIALNGTSVLGQSGATVDLTSAGGVNEAAGATLTAGTLQSTGGVTGGAANFAGTANAITTLGGFAVPGNSLSLSDTGTLNVTGPVTASAVTIGGAAGSTPSTITADGSIGATNTLSLTSGAGGITLNNGAALTGQTVDLDSGTGGIALTGNALVGQANAVVDLTAGAAGVTEFNSSTIVAATLQGNVAGPVQLGDDNTVLTVGSFTVTGAGNAFELRDTGTLAVTGPLTATGDVSLNAIGTGTGNAITITGIVSSGGTLSAGSGLGAVALQTGAVLTAPTISLQADGITLTGNASVGEAGAVVELGSFGGFITEAGTSIITAATLQTTALGSAGAVSLLSTRNAIGTLGTFTIFGSSGDSLTLIDSIPLTVTGPVTANNPPAGSQNVVLEASGSITVDGPITASGDIILATGGAGPITPPPTTEAPLITVQGATVTSTGGSVSLLAGPGGTVQLGGTNVSGSLVAGSGQLATLQMDTLSVAGPASSITAPGGTIEIAPATPGNAIDFATGASNTLTIPASEIATMSAGTLRLGAVTINGTETTTAGAIALDAAVDLTGHATTLQLLATGPITEPGGPLTVNALTADATAITLLNANNAIGNLGPLSATTGNITINDSSALTIAGLVDASAGNVYLETSNGGGITFGAFAVESVAGGTVGLQTNALANLGTTGATGVVNTGATGTFELSPNTASPVTLGTAGGGLSLTGLTGITAGLVRIGAVTQPGNTSPTVIASSITIGADFGTPGAALELDATGEVTEDSGANLTAKSLTGTAAAFQLPSIGNAIGAIKDLDATAGNITVVDGENLVLTGQQNGNNLFYEVANAGGTLSLGTGKIAAQLTAATGGRISLVADNVNEAFDSVVTATGGTVELAPSSAINASVQGSNGLVIDAKMLSIISTGPTGTLVVGGFTDVPNGGTVPAPRASSISVDAPTDIAGATAGTLDLLATGQVSQSALLSVGTLIGKAGSVVLDNNSNNIATLGSFTTTTAGFDLNDGGNLVGTLTVTGPVTAATTATIDTGATGAIDVTGSIGAGSVLALISGSGGITLNGNATLTGPTIDLAASAGVIALNGNSVVGQNGAAINLTTTGNITQAASSTLVAASLQTEGGAVVDLAGTANAVGALNGVVASTSFTLNDDTNLTVNDELLAPRIALLAPGQTVTLSNGATIITDGTPPPSHAGPLAPADEPSNGAPGAYIEAASFTQVGTSTLTSQATAGPTLQISITNSAQFDPPLGLQAANGWLILNLGNGTAAGNVVVNALNVTYTVPGSANLTGTVAGVAGTLAAASAFIQPAVNDNYLFNGCEIGSAACIPFQELPPGEVPPFGPPDLIAPPTLAGLLPFQLLALPIATPACTSAAPATGEANAPEHACALTDPDVVPPNVSYVDY